MSEQRVRYYVMRSSETGSIIQLSRIIWDAEGEMQGQHWHAGEWVDDDGVIREVMDLMVDDATEEEVRQALAASPRPETDD
jgi:hypothetical protein